MTVLNYIREQKRKLEERHLGETFLCLDGEEPVAVSSKDTGRQTDVARSAWEILREIDGLRGLNVRERECACAPFKQTAFYASYGA